MTNFAIPDNSASLPVPPSKSDRSHPSVYCLIKRTIDIVGSLVGLTIFALIYVPVAIAIKLDSKGPVLYKQERCGLKGRCFTIYKFRSMVKNADELKGAMKGKPFYFKEGEDPRVTRVGRFLRKTSLDEFPQFWNILKGEMSLVGTRPPTLDEVSNYKEHHWRRLDVKPGLTGEWQVNGRSTIKNFEEIVSLDLRYQDLWHPLYDLQIIGRTISVVLNGRGAS